MRRPLGSLALSVALAVLIAGCSTSANQVSPVPVVANIAPRTGTTEGGTTVTITGANFIGATSVTFGSVAAVSFNIVSATEVTAVSPAQAASTQDVLVTTPGGTSKPVKTVDQFTYTAPVPVVKSIAPSSGTTAGGTIVTIAGTGLVGATKVTFGSVPAATYNVVSDTEITAVSPAQAAGTQYVLVTTAGGTSKPVVSADQFTYSASVPIVTKIAPASGVSAGGTTVTITGGGLTGTTKVTFGTAAAVSYSVVSDTEITAVSPPQPAGTVNVLVTTAGGTSKPAASGDQFTYTTPVPVITKISPTSGPSAGGTTVTITGSGFTGATRVTFGSLAATSFMVVSDTEITAVSPPQTASTRYVAVTTIGKTSKPVASVDQFTYTTPAPVISMISPTSGPSAGGTTVTITGSNLSGATRVVFGGVPATSFAVVSDTEITAVAPAQGHSTRPVTVTTPGGSSQPSSVDQFIYAP